ncbi:hypothetical protein DEJ51_19855 [Streptomyces venezuelae]|uniref:Uncharacterized protein n=1 Tax=Streptomyces venezuelae TaxID=54571 RepID=A0A5P2DPA2_STRVZ|nr:hypothetical protein [Streptomyces venezuelae]QES56137.1 hypothetical protein DEJ51_19855 [Streptomyces venezuelae]
MGGKDEDARGAGISDEELAEFLERASSGSGQAPREPSARARMVTERLRDRQDPPPGWRTGPVGPRTRGGRGRGGRRIKATLAVVFIAGLALVALRPELVIDRVTGKAGARQDAKAPLAAETARPTAPPPPVDPDQPTLKEPFRGSPALQWADGAAGIEVPEATAVGWLPKEKVAEALQQVRQFLVAANLDPATLRGERPATALALLDPQQPDVPQRLEQYLTRPTAQDTPVTLFTRFDPAAVKPVGDVVKVRGSMRVEEGEPGEVRVVTDYTFVHPMSKGGTSVQRTIVRRQITLSLLDPARWKATGDRLQLHEHRAEWSNVECGTADGYLHPQFPQDAPTGPTPTGPATDPYDRSKDISGGECGTLTRS